MDLICSFFFAPHLCNFSPICQHRNISFLAANCQHQWRPKSVSNTQTAMSIYAIYTKAIAACWFMHFAYEFSERSIILRLFCIEREELDVTDAVDADAIDMSVPSLHLHRDDLLVAFVHHNLTKWICSVYWHGNESFRISSNNLIANGIICWPQLVIFFFCKCQKWLLRGLFIVEVGVANNYYNGTCGLRFLENQSLIGILMELG